MSKDFFGEEDKALLFAQEGGIRLHGNQSRVAVPQKSFNLYARKDYDGHKTFQKPFFEDGLKNGLKYKKLVLNENTVKDNKNYVLK